MTAACNASAHCSTVAPADSIPPWGYNVSYLPVVGGMSFPYSAFLNGYSQVTTSPEASEAERLLQAQPRKGRDDTSDRLLRLIHPVLEPLSPGDFVERAVGFFKSIGNVHVASAEVDGKAIYKLDAANPVDFSAIREKAEEYIRSRNEKVREISLNVFGKNDFFFLDVALLYRPVHSQREPGLTLAIGMTPESLHARPGESFDEVSARSAELMTDGPERDQFLADCRTRSQDLISDLSHHISSAFPGTRLKVLTEDESPVQRSVL